MQTMRMHTLSKPALTKAVRPAKRAVVRCQATTEEAPATPVAAAESSEGKRKPSPLSRGGTLAGAQAAGKDAGAKALATVGVVVPKFTMQIVDGRFRDDRWVDGCWDFTKFKNAQGETDWDAVIDAEMARRKLLEDTPIPSVNEDQVNFDTSMVPWHVWMRRFHLPEAEKANGRAAMIGYVLALLVDQLTGVGLLDQQNSFLGKVLLHVTVFAILFIRNTEDINKIKNLWDEATLYDAQWNATWVGSERPSEKASSQ